MAAKSDSDADRQYPRTASLYDAGADSQPGVGVPRGGVLGRYVVLYALGSGGMGHVYAAYDPDLDRKVALKVLRADILTSDRGVEARSRLRREAQAAAKLAHPNVVAVHDVGTVGDQLFLAMELVDGPTLAEWLTAEPRDRRQVLDLFLKAGRGLAAAHRAGVVHRDFKPGNVVVASGGVAKVLDFGLARAVEAPDEIQESGPPERATEPVATEALRARLTQTGKALGTPAYMAPEQRRGEPADARCDQYAFCAALHEALTGRLPDLDETRRERSIAAAGLPPWLRSVLTQGLADAPGARFASMEALLQRLATDPGRRRRRWALSAVAAAAALGLVLWQASRPRVLLCKGAERRLAGVWDAPSQASIRDAFAATGLSFAEPSWRATKQTLDRHAGRWVEAHTEACEATHLRGEQSAAMLDLQMACLDTRLAEMRAVVDIFRRPDRDVVMNAAASAATLSEIDRCADRAFLQSSPVFPSDPALRETVAGIRAQVARVEALRRAGKFEEAREISSATLSRAEATSFDPVLGEVKFQHGILLGRFGRLDEFREQLLESVEIALFTRHDELFARAATYLIVPSTFQGSFDEAELWGRLAGSAIGRLERRDELQAWRQLYLGLLANARGRHETAIEHFRNYLRLKPSITPAERGTALQNIGLAMLRLGRSEQALETLRQAAEELRAGFSVPHPNVALTLTTIGEAFFAQGRPAEALELHLAAVAELEEAVGPDHPDLSDPLSSAGEALAALDRPDEAVAAIDRAISIRTGAGYDPADLAVLQRRLAEVLWRTGKDHERALQVAREARRAFAAMGERGASELEQVDAWIQDRASGR